MAVNWKPAEPAQRAAEWLIGSYHADLRNNGVQVTCLFRDDEPQRGGRTQWYDTVRISGLASWLAFAGADGSESSEDGAEAGAFFVLWFSLPVWAKLSDLQRLAMVDAALCACSAGVQETTGKTVLSKDRPDLAVFFDNIERFGAWFEDAEKAVAVLRDGAQIGLPLDLGPLDARVTQEQAAEVLAPAVEAQDAVQAPSESERVGKNGAEGWDEHRQAKKRARKGAPELTVVSSLSDEERAAAAAAGAA